MQESLSDRLENCYTGAVYDVLRAMGFPNQTLSNDISPLDISSKLSGRIFTVSGRYDETLEPHDTLLQWTGLLSKAGNTNFKAFTFRSILPFSIGPTVNSFIYPNEKPEIIVITNSDASIL